MNGVLSQAKSGLGGGEIRIAENILKNLDIKHKVITGDAMFAQEGLCKNIVVAEGNYVFKVKSNKQQIISDIAEKFKSYNEENRMLESHETITRLSGVGCKPLQAAFIKSKGREH